MSTSLPPAGIAWPNAARRDRFGAWLAGLAAVHGLDPTSLRTASADASFRRYFRVDARAGGGSFVVMDAPPPEEDVRPFCAVAARLEAAGLLAPRVLARDDADGFLLLTDLGRRLVLDALREAVGAGDDEGRDALMRAGVEALIGWQRGIDPAGLPPYDAALLRRELALFPEWCVRREFGIVWTPAEDARWTQVVDRLVEDALAQPTVAVHRDFMPRNLMVTPEGLGLLDFQDAARGPIAYDLASLLRDAFVSWEEDLEIDWAVRYWQAARRAGLPVHDDFGEFWRQVEWIGLQRHLKVLGIFCRLKHRDGKPAYRADLPRFFRYAHKVANRYGALRPLVALLEPPMGVERVEAFY